ncbi:MAG: LPS export ABC transporter permease LptF [Candidatus Tectomicrobia bacterium]
MRCLDRYILREFIPFFTIAFMVVTLVLLLEKLLWLTTLVLQNRLDWFTSIRFLSYTLPTISGLTLPMAFLIGCTLTFNRLSADSEYVVMRAAGISFYRLLAPLLAVGVLMYGLSSLLHLYVSPWGVQGLRRLFFEVAQSQAHYFLRPGEFHDTFRGLIVYVEHTSPDVQRLEGIFIADVRSATPQVITAREGKLLTYADALQVVLRLKQGRIHRYVAAEKRYQLLRFERYDIRLNIDTRLARQVSGAIRPRELFPSQLRAEITRRRAAGENARRFIFHWHQLFALPFTCILFAALGPSLGVVHTRSGRSGGYIFGLCAIFAYYLCLIASNVMGEETVLSPLGVAWLPNLLMGGVTLWLLRRTARAASQLDMTGVLDWGLRLWQRWRPRPQSQKRPQP